MNLGKYATIMTLSTASFFLPKKICAQETPQDNVNLIEILENKKEDLSEYYLDPRFTANMDITTKMHNKIFEGIVLREPYGGIELTGKVAGMVLGGSYTTTKNNGSTTLHIDQKGFKINVEFDKLYDNHKKDIDTNTIIYYGTTTFATVELEGVVKVQYHTENDSLKLNIDARLGPMNWWDSFKFEVGDVAGEVPDEEEIAGWNQSLQRDFNNAATVIQFEFMPLILDYSLAEKKITKAQHAYLSGLIQK